MTNLILDEEVDISVVLVFGDKVGGSVVTPTIK